MSEFASDDLDHLEFDEILSALQNEAEPFPARYLYRLSGLEGEELRALKGVWAQLSGKRRLGLLEDLEFLAEANTVMHFDSIARLGMDDEAEMVRVVALRSLWQSENESLVPELLEILNNDDSIVARAQAASTLGRFVYLGELGRISREMLDEVANRLLELMEEDIDPLIRRRALEALGYSSRERVADLIEDSYEYGDEEWQASALFAMGRSADKHWAPQVIERLDDSNPDLSREAARAAGELRLEEAVPALMALLHDESSQQRITAAWSLSQIGGAEAAEALNELLERTRDEDELDLIEDALENLALTEEIEDLALLDFSEEDLKSWIETSEDPPEE